MIDTGTPNLTLQTSMKAVLKISDLLENDGFTPFEGFLLTCVAMCVIAKIMKIEPERVIDTLKSTIELVDDLDLIYREAKPWEAKKGRKLK